MERITLLFAVLLLGACASLGLDKPNCYESVAISKITITEAFKTATRLSDGEIISTGAAQDALIALDQANSATDSAAALCPLDAPRARDYLIAASNAIENATNLMEASDE